jgi:hypothetical protein
VLRAGVHSLAPNPVPLATLSPSQSITAAGQRAQSSAWRIKTPFTHLHAYMHIHMCTHVYSPAACECMHAPASACPEHMCSGTHLHTQAHTCIAICLPTYIKHACVHNRVSLSTCMHMCIREHECACTQTHLSVLMSILWTRAHQAHVPTYMCICVCTHTHASWSLESIILTSQGYT